MVFPVETRGHLSVLAGQTEGSGQPINEAKLEGDRLTFSVTVPAEKAGEKGPTWKFDLKVSGTRMEGRAEGTKGDRSLGSTDVVNESLELGNKRRSRRGCAPL